MQKVKFPHFYGDNSNFKLAPKTFEINSVILDAMSTPKQSLEGNRQRPSDVRHSTEALQQANLRPSDAPQDAFEYEETMPGVRFNDVQLSQFDVLFRSRRRRTSNRRRRRRRPSGSRTSTTGTSRKTRMARGPRSGHGARRSPTGTHARRSSSEPRSWRYAPFVLLCQYRGRVVLRGVTTVTTTDTHIIGCGITIRIDVPHRAAKGVVHRVCQCR